MPYLHCIATKCTIPPSESFPWFFSTALPRSASTPSRRSLSLVFVRSKALLSRRFLHCDNCNYGSTGALIACVVVAVLALILGIGRAIWLRQQRERVSAGAKLNMNTEYWARVRPANHYEMNSDLRGTEPGGNAKTDGALSGIPQAYRNDHHKVNHHMDQQNMRFQQQNMVHQGAMRATA